MNNEVTQDEIFAMIQQFRIMQRQRQRKEGRMLELW